MAKLNLYRVSYIIEVPVLAESAEDAEMAILLDVDWADDIKHGDAVATEVTADDMPQEWYELLPWTKHNVKEKTCGQLLGLI